jgi:hypothetical protein
MFVVSCDAIYQKSLSCTPRICLSACRGDTQRTPCSCFSPCRGGRGCTPCSPSSACREGTGCTPRSYFSASRGGKGCTPRTWLSTCREGRDCTLRRSLSPCREGRGCIPRSRVSACRGGTLCTPRRSLSPCRGGSRCTPHSGVSACRGGSRCTPRRPFSACRGSTGCTPRSFLSACRGGRGRTPHNVSSPFHASTFYSVPSRLVHHGITQIPRPAASANSIFPTTHHGCIGTLGSVRRSRHESARACTRSVNALRSHLLFWPRKSFSFSESAVIRGRGRGTSPPHFRGATIRHAFASAQYYDAIDRTEPRSTALGARHDDSGTHFRLSVSLRESYALDAKHRKSKPRIERFAAARVRDDNGDCPRAVGQRQR